MQAAAQNAEAIRIVVVLIAIAVVAFWRKILKLMIIVIATAMIAGIGYAVIEVWQQLHHLTG
ncbi:MAG TPA: hypothetical protein VGI58_19205 [Streptosporangiaceae bacterium]|jgi:hypothetical protein